MPREPLEAIMLVGGKGTRLRPLTLSAPKPLLPTAGVPFLAHQLARLGRQVLDQLADRPLAQRAVPDQILCHRDHPSGSGIDVPAALTNVDITELVKQQIRTRTRPWEK